MLGEGLGVDRVQWAQVGRFKNELGERLGVGALSGDDINDLMISVGWGGGR